MTKKHLLGVLAGISFLALMPLAHADDDDYDPRLRFASKATNPKWVTECGACHIAFPPHFLPAESWREIMSGLDKHFGSDASLDAETAGEITAFLEQHSRLQAVSLDAAGKPLLRITEYHWFRNEHDEILPRVWKSAKVKSRANCSACHTSAEQGDYSERNIRIPK